MKVAALYIDPRGPYPGMPDVDCWDATRDARRYRGPHPVVAHPPCGAYSRLKHFYKRDDADCALYAVQSVRLWGGALEHPAHSRLWQVARLPLPGAPPDAWGGYAIEVAQVDWGHVARKATWLYLVRVPRAIVQATLPTTHREPTHWIAGNTEQRKRAGMKAASSEQSRRSPLAFAEWLVSLARASVGQPRAR